MDSKTGSFKFRDGFTVAILILVTLTKGEHMRSNMQFGFGTIPKPKVNRSVFKRNHRHLTTFDAGYLIPILVDEALPGDTIKCKPNVLARLMTPVAPIMDNLFIDQFYFAVPMRLLWENWEKFCGAQTDPGDSTEYSIPQIVSDAGTGFTEGSLEDYMGIPVGVTSLSVSCMWHRAYNLVMNEWFRHEDLEDSLPVNKGDGPDSISDYSLFRRCKAPDYFTACLPWPQKGEEISLPLGTEAPVIGDGTALGLDDEHLTPYGYALRGKTNRGDQFLNISLSGDGYQQTLPYEDTSTYDIPHENYVFGLSQDPDKSGVIADLSEAAAATINMLRTAEALQCMMERDARGGTRYVEIIKSHFGVMSPDFRLDRPEYLGGSSQRMNVVPVQQTSETNTTELGTLGAFGQCAGREGGFIKTFDEHCVIIGLANVRAQLTYQQGLDRMFSRSVKEEFYWPDLAHLGEQEVLNKEIYCDGSANDDDVFGYQERWSEYRFKQSRITGNFRSDATYSLDVWHLAEDFGSLPTLNQDFIESDPPLARISEVQNEHHIKADFYFEYLHARLMPTYSIPGLRRVL